MKKPIKSFDCIEFKRESQRRIYEDTKKMTPEEEIEYFRKKAEEGPFAELLKRLKGKDKPKK
jgi:hypothetical protein